MKLCQNVWHHEMSDKIETGSKGLSFILIFMKLFFFSKCLLGSLKLGQAGMSTRSLGQILEKIPVYTLKGTILIRSS